MSRGIWFVAGAGAGVYVMLKARRAAEALSPEGLRDRLSGLSLGAHLFGEEIRTGMAEKETELRTRLGLSLDGTPELMPAGQPKLVPPGSDRASTSTTNDDIDKDNH